MMEIYFMASGNKFNMDIFESRLNTIPVMLPFKDKDGKEFKQPIFSQLSEIKLFRLIIPKEYKDSFLLSLGLPEKSIDSLRYSAFDKQSYLLRKALNAKKLENPDPKAEKMYIFKEGIALKEIGYKEDPEMTHNGITQESI